MADPFTGEIRVFSFDYPPIDWAYCNGLALSVGQFAALASVIGYKYGGNGRTIFNLPNLQGRVPVGYGIGPGLTPRDIGEQWGKTAVTAPLPAHNHNLTAQADTVIANLTDAPVSGLSHISRTIGQFDFGTTGTHVAMAVQSIAPTGVPAATPHDNMQPYLALNFCICLNGIYPIRP